MGSQPPHGLLPGKRWSCYPEGFYRFRKLNDVLEFVIVTDNSVTDPPACFYDQARDLDKGNQKAFKFVNVQ